MAVRERKLAPAALYR